VDTAVRTPLIVIGSVLALAAVSTVVLSAVVEPAAYESGTPEAVVQEFVRSALDGDTERALALIDPARDCRRLRFEPVSSASTSATIADVRVSGTVATVDVDFSEDDADPFGTGWDHRETFGLIRSGGTWYLETTTWLSGPCLR
jgi:hypothetical protein